MFEEPDPILIQVTIPLPIPMIHAAFTDPEKVSGWLADRANIEPRVGGAYELTWTSDPTYTSPGRVTQITPELDLGFSWFAPPQFDEVANRPEPKTSVYVRLQESPEGIDVTLEHVGWQNGDLWEDARSWHFHFWDGRLHRLKDYLIQAVYG